MTAGAKTAVGGSPRPTKGVAARITGTLASVPFASAVVALIATACIIGTLLPQGSQVQQYLGKNPNREALMDLLGFAGLTNVFSSWWFVGLLLLLAASLSVCTFRRYSAAMRQKGRPRGRALGSMITHVSMLLVLCGGVVRVVWGERGQLAFREGDTANAFLSADGSSAPLPFSIKLVDFEIEMHGDKEPRKEALNVKLQNDNDQWSLPVAVGVEKRLVPKGQADNDESAYVVTILRRIPDFVMDSSTKQIMSRSDALGNAALQVQVVHNTTTNTQWVFALHPGFNMHGDGEAPPLDLLYTIQAEGRTMQRRQVKDYKSTLQIFEGDTLVKEKTIEVNDPLSHKGFTFYQSGYDQRDPKWTSLQVVRDPGVPLVYTGFLLLIAGLTMVFYLYPHGRHER